MQALYDSAYALEGPQFRSKVMFRGTLQNGRTYSGELLHSKLGWTASLANSLQRIHVGIIE